MKKYLTRIGLFVGVIAYIGFLFYFWRSFEHIRFFSLLKEGVWYYVAGAAVSSVAMVAGTGILIAEIFKLYGASCSRSEGIGLWLASIGLGMATAGLSLPILLFSTAKKKTHSHITSIAITASVFIFYFLPIFIFLLLLFLITPVRIVWLQEFRMPALLLGLCTLGAVLLFLFRKKIKEYLIYLGTAWFGANEEDLRGAWLRLRSISKKQMMRIFLISCIALLFNFSILVFSLYSLHEHIHVMTAFSNFILSELITIVSPSAGGLGFVEVTLAGLLGLSGLTTASALTATLIFRVFNFWLPTIAGAIYVFLSGYQSFVTQKND